MDKSIRKVAEALPVLTIAVISVGYFNLHSLYSRFHISIYNYLDTSEIVFSFAALAYDISILLCTSCAYAWMGAVLKHNTAIDAQTIAQKAMMRKIGPFIFIFLIIAGRIAVMHNPTPLFYSDGHTLMFTSMVLVPLLVADLYLLDLPLFSRLRIRILVAVGLLLFFHYLHVLTGVYHKLLSSGRGKYFVQLTLESGKEIKTNYNFVFVGETRRYYFFHDIITHTSTIIPSSEVVEIEQRLSIFDSRNLRELIEGRVQSDSIR